MLKGAGNLALIGVVAAVTAFMGAGMAKADLGHHAYWTAKLEPNQWALYNARHTHRTAGPKRRDPWGAARWRVERHVDGSRRAEHLDWA